MYYVVKSSDSESHLIVDTYTLSICECEDEETLSKFLKLSTSDKIDIKPNELIVLEIIDDETYRCIKDTDEITICKYTYNKLKNEANSVRIKNARFINDKLQFCSEVNIIKTDKEFKHKIQSNYAKLKAKAKLLGIHLDISIDIEGYNVRLKNYSGESLNFTIPDWITSIENDAFFLKTMTNIVIGKNVKYIGEGAFQYNDIQKLEIPESVEVILSNAFNGSSSIVNDSGEFNSNVIVRNKNTIILNQNI